MRSNYSNINDLDVSHSCTYCGVMADTVDHVVPRLMIRMAEDAGVDLRKVFRLQSWTLPACRECNSIIGSRVFPTLRDRRAFAHKGIRRKWAAYLRIPDWSDSELAHVGVRAREDILRSLKIRDWVLRRLRWDGARNVSWAESAARVTGEIAGELAKVKP